jgi:hypothetical protein
MTLRMSRSCFAQRAPTRSFSASGATLRRQHRRRSAGVRRQVAEKAPNLAQCFGVAVDNAVDQTRGFGVQLPAAEFFGIDSFADR